MKTNKIVLALLGILMIFGLMMTTVSAAPTFPNLPPNQVNMIVTFGEPILNRWPSTAVFSGIPMGYDVQNSVAYTAWCAEFYSPITSGNSYQVTLESSLGISTTWNKVNYLLNHNSGQDLDLQVAIWLLLGTAQSDITERYGATQPSTDALNMFNVANTNGGTFIPSVGNFIAVIANSGADYQDIIIQLRKTCYEGLTPGFWKNHPSAWPTGYSTTQTINSVFSNTGLSSTTLLDALRFGGGPGIAGAKQILLRAAVAALLNSASATIDYPLAPDQIITQVNAALGSNNRGTMLTLAAQLDYYNNLGT